MADLERANSEENQAPETCATSCPKYLACLAMRETGKADLSRTAVVGGDVEFEQEDGSLVDAKTYFDPDPINPDAAEMLRDAGNNLVRASEMLEDELLAGCVEGKPIELSTGQLICASANRGAVEFTEADLA